LEIGMNILMSEPAIAQYGPAIEQLTPVNWIHLGSSPNAQGVYATDVAFITREVTGLSTKNNVLPTLARYYEILRASPNLSWIQAHSAGADRPIFAEMMARGVRVATASGANAAPVAHTAVAALLALGRRFHVQTVAQQSKVWTQMMDDPALVDLTGQSVLVVGLGSIGVLIAQFLTALGLRVTAVTHDVSKHQAILGMACEAIFDYKNFKAQVPKMDYVVLACPLTPTTKHLVDATFLKSMKPTSYLVNVARGESVVEVDLIAALQNKTIAGAFLDGFEIEPLPVDSPLWTMPNVIFSSHTAGHFAGHHEQVFQIFLKNLVRHLKGESLINEVKA
jgi:phosphoglycerate dehydrogenase-like enzyme